MPGAQVKATALSLGRMWSHLLPVFFILNGVHRTARLGVQHEVEASVLTEATGIAEEGVLLVVIDGSEEVNSLGQGDSRGLVGWGRACEDMDCATSTFWKLLWGLSERQEQIAEDDLSNQVRKERSRTKFRTLPSTIGWAQEHAHSHSLSHLPPPPLSILGLTLDTPIISL